MDDLQARLLEEIGSWEIIDCHEHLAEESARVGKPVDALTLFSHYTHNDLITAGMTREAYDRLLDYSVPVEERWRAVAPYWERIRFTGYGRAVTLAVRRFYGCEELSDDTYQVIGERMRAANTPGLYRRVLREACRIRVALTQIGRVPDEDRDLLVPLLPAGNYGAVPTRERLEERAGRGDGVADLAAYGELLRADLRAAKAQGVVGLKIMSHPLPPAEPEAAVAAFTRLREGRDFDPAPLQTYLEHEVFEAAAEEGLVVAVHCGLIWTNWGDFTATNPLHMVPTLAAHRRTRFDLYHAGLPWVRETGVIGKTFPNVWLNLCWCHIISPEMTKAALNEWLDLVPYTKILGFGGDYGVPVEKVYGHLRLAQEDLAAVLAGRVAGGSMTEHQALTVAHAWLWDNPVELYSLQQFVG